MRWMLVMTIFVPLSIVLKLAGASQGWVFTTSALAIVPLAGYIGKATEELSKQCGPGVAGLLNATFGNATELIICLVAVHGGQIEVVKASLIGSIIGNVLLVLGVSVLAGGIRYKIQTFNKDAAQSGSAMLAVAVISLLVPALFVRDSTSRGVTEAGRIEALSLGVAGVLIILYCVSLVFALHTHEDLFQTTDKAAPEPQQWKHSVSLLVLCIATILVAAESEMLVGSIDSVVHQWGLNKMFLGIIIIPIVGNAAEHTSAVMMALKNKMDVSLNIAISSSTQIAMFVAPLIIFISPMFGHPVSILFDMFELVAVTGAAAIAVLITIDGKSHWLEGGQLLATYIIVALAFYFFAG